MPSWLKPGGRLPGRRAVAHAALGRRGDVRRRLARRLDVVVAARARTLHLRVIDAGRGLPGRHGVAGLAGRRREQVRGVLARRLDAVVAAGAAAGDAGVRERCRLSTRSWRGTCRIRRWSECGSRPCRSPWCRRGNWHRCPSPGCGRRGRRLPGRYGVAGLAACCCWRCAPSTCPCALTPSWQLEQLFVMPVWSKRRRLPGQRRMAAVAGVVARNVSGRLAGGLGAVVAGGARTGDLRVIDAGGGLPCERGVAGGAGRAGRDVSRVLAGGRRAVVARGTAAAHLGVVDLRDRAPRERRVAVATGRAREDVRRALAGGPCAVMAGCAGFGQPGVREVGGSPLDGRVATVAGIVGQDVSGALAGRNGAVVAGNAVAEHLRVVDTRSGLPGRDDVARLARRRSPDVGRILAVGAGAVVTRSAVGGDPRVVELGWSPGAGRVAVVAFRRSRNVIGRLSLGRESVVAGRAAAQHVGVVHSCGWLPCRRRMTRRARGRCLDVTRAGAGSARPVVAADAAIDDAVVAEAGRLPRHGHVAGVAGGRRRYVQCMLARC